jgi:hypothetical protein
MRLPRAGIFCLGFLLLTRTASAQEEPISVKALKTPPPDGIAKEIRDGLSDSGYQVVDGQGKAYAEIWLRKGVAAKGSPSGPNGPILYPILETGELLGVLRFSGEGFDFREQPIKEGVYTLRYGLLPENGAHLGVSEYRDYTLLVPVADDQDTKKVPLPDLQKRSMKSSGTNHPAVLMLGPPPEAAPAAGEGAIVHDELKRTWGLAALLGIEAGGKPASLPIQLIVVGAAMD